LKRKSKPAQPLEDAARAAPAEVPGTVGQVLEAGPGNGPRYDSTSADLDQLCSDMASITRGDTDRGIFVMDQFRVTAPGRLEVAGRWEGVEGANLEDCALVLEVDGRVARMGAERVDGTARRWQAAFRWDGDASAIEQAVLEVGGELAVELGAQPTARRWRSRVTRPVVPLKDAGPEAQRPAPARDLVSLHAALAAAQDELAEAKEEINLAREDARRARADADRERVRRQHDAVRLHGALDRLKQVADAKLREERERFDTRTAEFATLGRALAEARAELGAARKQASTAVQERKQLSEDRQAELDAANAELAAARKQLEALEARDSELRVVLSDARAEAQRLADVEAEHARARAALAEAQRVAEDLREEAAQATAELANARRTNEELRRAAADAGRQVEDLQAELDQVRRAGDRSARELERAHQQSQESERLRATVQELETALADARRAGADAVADAARLRDRLAAIRSALSGVAG
jgi:hypothetical protein